MSYICVRGCASVWSASHYGPSDLGSFAPLSVCRLLATPAPWDVNTYQVRAHSELTPSRAADSRPAWKQSKKGSELGAEQLPRRGPSGGCQCTPTTPRSHGRVPTVYVIAFHTSLKALASHIAEEVLETPGACRLPGNETIKGLLDEGSATVTYAYIEGGMCIVVRWPSQVVVPSFSALLTTALAKARM